MKSFTIPQFGEFSYEDFLGAYRAEPREFPLFPGNEVTTSISKHAILEDDVSELAKVLDNVFSMPPSRLKKVERHVHQYYLDTIYEEPELEVTSLKKPRDVWQHIKLGNCLWLNRRGDDGILYVSIECNCVWNPEHGLDLILRNGEVFSRVGPHNFNLLYTDIHGDDSYEGVIYDSILEGPML